LIYCQANLTDGFIPEHAVPTFGVRVRNQPELRTFVAELCASQVPGRGPLWHRVPGGYQVHDYLDWNDSRQQVEEVRASNKRRTDLFKNPELRGQIRQRDGNDCRYCGRVVRWDDRKSEFGGTYDHVDPKGPNTLENLVVACRGCNTKKGPRTPAQAGIPLRQAGLVYPPELEVSNSKSTSISKSESDSDPASTSTTTADQNPDQDQRRSRVAPSEPDENIRVLTKLAHSVLDDVRNHAVDPADGPEELKRRAAKAGIRYDGDRVRKALDSAVVQRDHARRRA
jgi:5-methylcytosine-specific restriction endonuclease McrA